MLAAIVRIRSSGPMPPANRFLKADPVVVASDRRFPLLSPTQQFFS